MYNIILFTAIVKAAIKTIVIHSAEILALNDALFRKFNIQTKRDDPPGKHYLEDNDRFKPNNDIALRYSGGLRLEY